MYVHVYIVANPDTLGTEVIGEVSSFQGLSCTQINRTANCVLVIEVTFILECPNEGVLYVTHCTRGIPLDT